MSNSIIKFKAGSVYQIKFIGDSSLKVDLKVDRVSASSIWANVDGKQKRMKIKVWDSCEYVDPYGVYSMNPSCRASSQK